MSTDSKPGPDSTPYEDDGGFDPGAKERALRAEADSWDTSSPTDARPGDIPVIDVAPWFATGNDDDLRAAAAELRHACETIGFHQLVGHGIAPTVIADAFDWTRRFHALPVEMKERILMDRPGWPLGGVGYLPVGERKLPRRAVGNRNEAFLIKGDGDAGYDEGQWPEEGALPGFRAAVEAWATTLRGLAVRLLPLYATALDLAPDFFADAFVDPFWRLRLSHYPAEQGAGVPAEQGAEAGAFGIAPHVDTTFFTLLLQDGPGLVIHHAADDRWIRVPVVENAFVVNSGELLRQWSNDRFLSTRHFADNRAGTSRHSIPFFFNANRDHPMACLPTCHGPGNPPRYATISYRQSQAAVQGE